MRHWCMWRPNAVNTVLDLLGSSEKLHVLIFGWCLGVDKCVRLDNKVWEKSRESEKRRGLPIFIKLTHVL